MPTNKELQVGRDFSVPLDAVTQAFAFIGRRGTGKSYAAAKMFELMYDAGAQCIAIDVVGIWWGLRLSADGKKPGLNIPIFGGLNADVPLEVGAGAIIADLLVDRGISAVIDVSQCETDAERTRFLTDFFTRFFFRKKSSPSAVHLFIEEAQEVIPQNPQKGEERLLHASQRTMRLGRNYGIGMSLLSQRPQDVNKKALSQAECLFAFQLIGPHEKRAIKDWVNEKGLDDPLDEILPLLPQGQAHVWSPVWLNVSRLVKVGARRTYAAGSTPKVGDVLVKAKPLDPIELAGLGKQIQETIQRAKEDDPAYLKTQIKRLNAEAEKQVKIIEKLGEQLHANKGRVETKVMKPDSKKFHADLDKAGKEFFRAAAKLLDGISDSADKFAGSPPVPVREHAEAVAADTVRQNERGSQIARIPTVHAPRALPKPGDILIPRKPAGSAYTPDHVPAQVPVLMPVNEATPIKPLHKKILAALAQYHPKPRSRVQAAMLTGSKLHGGFDQALADLRKWGLLQGSGAALNLTEAGLRAIGPNYDPLPTGDDLVLFWSAKLPGLPGKIVRVLIGVYPQTMSRAELAQHAESKLHGGFDQALADLRKLELITGPGHAIQASEAFFQ